MGIVVYFLPNRLTSSTLIDLVLSVFLGGFIYLALLFLLQEFRLKEREAIRQVFKKIFNI